MTDYQMKLFLAEVVENLEEVYEEVPESEKLKKLIDRYKRFLQD